MQGQRRLEPVVALLHCPGAGRHLKSQRRHRRYSFTEGQGSHYSYK